MPKFTSDELAEIRENADRLEASKEEKAKKKTKKNTSKSTKKHESTLQEKLIAPFLLFLLLAISYVIMVLNS